MCVICRGENIAKLHFLDISNCNQICLISDLPDNITEIWCDRCPNLKIIELPKSLKRLFIAYCPCTILKLPENLLELSIGECPNLTSFSHFPEQLRYIQIWCCHSLTFLPNLPASLEELVCRDCNKLFSIPNFPKNLSMIDCRYTRISKVPENIPRIYDDGCPWLDSNFPDRESRFVNLIKLQKSIKKFLKRRKVRISSIFRNIFPKEISALICKA